MSLVVVNGFCGRNCQDKYMSSLLYCLEYGIGNVPSTSNAEIFTRPPWELYDFFPRAYLPGENHRAWVFEHTAFPPELLLMPTFFKWSFDYYETACLNGLVMSVQHLKFSYKHEVHNNNSICDCNHQQNVKNARGWKMLRYKRGDFAICCLTYKGKEKKKPVPTRKKSSHRFFESGEGDDDDEETSKKTKKPRTKKSTPVGSLFCAGTGNVSQQGVKAQGIFLDAKGHCTGEAETKLEEGQTTKTIEDLNSSAKVPSDYLSHEEMLGFKKPKNKKDGLDISALEAEAVALGMGAGDLGSLKDGSRQALKEGKERSENEKQCYANETTDGDTVETPLALSSVAMSNQDELVILRAGLRLLRRMFQDLGSLKDGPGIRHVSVPDIVEGHGDVGPKALSHMSKGCF
uniref:SART-1 family protein DOT2 n=1 Tax=Noccaea caerulescens TaxID=107243 RepID=A0A1J3CEH9_NOCCA